MRVRIDVLVLATAALLAACAKDSKDKDPAQAGDAAPRAGTAAPSAQPAPGPAGAPATAPAKTEGVPGMGADEKYEKTASGLEYQVLKAGGPGKSPKLGDKVKVNYKGWLTDGNVFDESARHGGAMDMTVGEVIEGWNEALQLMTPGAKWRLRIPGRLAYGPQGSGTIPPNATLLFDVELLAVDAAPEFVKIDLAKAQTTASGLKWEAVKEGAGDKPTAEDPMELRILLFSPTGQLLNQQQMTARISDFNIPFLKEAPLLMKPGALYRFEVPPALAFGARSPGPGLPPNSTTYWEIELLRVLKGLPVPAFVKPDEAAMEKRPSGLMVHVDKEGEGVPPRMGQTVTVHYAGWLTDGTLFDSSYPRGEPAKFQVGRVIPGWNEALTSMKPGAVWTLVIPGNLAYGERGTPDGKIPPNATLVFRVELVRVE